MTVHPRVGGEQGRSAPEAARVVGSSPRGRGTATITALIMLARRFIPAWAGNRPAPRPRRTARAVHPRVGGEQCIPPPDRRPARGSSPRGRGTGRRLAAFPLRPRFIPAWAGNSCRQAPTAGCRPVHPRVGGEQACSSSAQDGASGSSPRGRGTDPDKIEQIYDARFIPAWAGNRGAIATMSKSISVHPRVGGEQDSRYEFAIVIVGSSPRGRGTARQPPDARYRCRFIPAWAGNSVFHHQTVVLRAVHPRVGGEQRTRDERVLDKPGSSPRGRGTASRLVALALMSRFIPAWAGNSSQRRRHGDRLTVHPRVGGEQEPGSRLLLLPAGSSPRGRGTARAPEAGSWALRFIPAWAGNSDVILRDKVVQAVHPRVGGEQEAIRGIWEVRGGSSPRGRGTGVLPS